MIPDELPLLSGTVEVYVVIFFLPTIFKCPARVIENYEVPTWLLRLIWVVHSIFYIKIILQWSSQNGDAPNGDDYSKGSNWFFSEKVIIRNGGDLFYEESHDKLWLSCMPFWWSWLIPWLTSTILFALKAALKNPIINFDSLIGSSVGSKEFHNKLRNSNQLSNQYGDIEESYDKLRHSLQLSAGS